MEELFDETKIMGAEEFKENRKISQMKEAQEERAEIWAGYLTRHPTVVDYYTRYPTKAQELADYWYEREQKKKREAEEKAISDELRERAFEERMRKSDEDWKSWEREEYEKALERRIERGVEKLNEADFWDGLEEEMGQVSLSIVP